MNSYFKQNTNELTQHLLEQHADHLPQLAKVAFGIREEFLELKATDCTAAVLTAYHNIDTIQADAYAESEQPISCFSCKAAYCCHISVEIAEIEAALIGQYCKENKIKISRKYLQKQLAHNRRSIGKADCSACVFLKDNRCSIYPVRPAGCRIHHVITPIEMCNIKDNRTEKIGMLTSSVAQVIKSIIFHDGGKIDRMPRLLLKYSQ